MQLAHDTHDQSFRTHSRPTHASTVSPFASNMSDTDRRTLDAEHETAKAQVGGAVTDAENGECTRDCGHEVPWVAEARCFRRAMHYLSNAT